MGLIGGRMPDAGKMIMQRPDLFIYILDCVHKEKMIILIILNAEQSVLGPQHLSAQRVQLHSKSKPVAF